MVTCTTALSNSVKSWTMLCRTTQDRRVIVESSDKTWSTGEGDGKPLQYSCLENPMNSMKRQKDMTLKDELPRSVGAQYATGEEWRNNSTKKYSYVLIRAFAFLFTCLNTVFLPFYTVHRVLKARMLKWFAIPFSSGPRFVRTLHHDLSILGDPTRHGS